MEKPFVVCVVGPTASGKTALSIALAKEFGGEVISADSMQIYRGMDIMTAKPSRCEMDGVPHHMLSVVDTDEEYSVSRYIEDAGACLSDVLSRGKLPIICGGTGFYIEMLLRDMDFSYCDSDSRVRQELYKLKDEKGIDYIYDLLAERDPESYKRLHKNDVKRVIRALEVSYLSDIKISEHNEKTRDSGYKYNLLFIGLQFADRALLYERINLRVDEMLKSGLLEEAKILSEKTLSKTALGAIGYKEIIDAVRDEGDIDAATEKLKQVTRNYAKRQITWFSKNPNIHWFYMDKQAKDEIFLNAIELVRRSMA